MSETVDVTSVSRGADAIPWTTLMTAKETKDCPKSDTMMICWILTRTYPCEKTPYVRCEKDYGRDYKERTLAPDVRAGCSKEGGETDPKGEETDDETRDHVDANVVLHRDER
jgi:hypothetical protein